MDGAQVYRETVDRFMILCKDTLGSDFNAFYEGDPIEIPAANLPCVIIEKIHGTISLTNAPTGHDRFVENISIRLLFNKSDDLGASDDADLTERRLRRYVEARDPQTGTYLAGTLMYALRNHITLSEHDFDADLEINYDVNPRPNQMVTSEAQIQVVVTGITPVPDRD